MSCWRVCSDSNLCRDQSRSRYTSARSSVRNSPPNPLLRRLSVAAGYQNTPEDAAFQRAWARSLITAHWCVIIPEIINGAGSWWASAGWKLLS